MLCYTDLSDYYGYHAEVTSRLHYQTTTLSLIETELLYALTSSDTTDTETVLRGCLGRWENRRQVREKQLDDQSSYFLLSTVPVSTLLAHVAIMNPLPKPVTYTLLLLNLLPLLWHAQRQPCLSPDDSEMHTFTTLRSLSKKINTLIQTLPKDQRITTQQDQPTITFSKLKQAKTQVDELIQARTMLPRHRNHAIKSS